MSQIMFTLNRAIRRARSWPTAFVARWHFFVGPPIAAYLATCTSATQPAADTRAGIVLPSMSCRVCARNKKYARPHIYLRDNITMSVCYGVMMATITSQQIRKRYSAAHRTLSTQSSLCVSSFDSPPPTGVMMPLHTVGSGGGLTNSGHHGGLFSM